MMEMLSTTLEWCEIKGSKDSGRSHCDILSHRAKSHPVFTNTTSIHRPRSYSYVCLLEILGFLLVVRVCVFTQRLLTVLYRKWVSELHAVSFPSQPNTIHFQTSLFNTLLTLE